METSTTALLVLSLIGTFAFGISGALAAVRAELDLFGVTVVAAATGLAGGILRDVLLGLRPTALRDWRFVAVVVGAAGLAILAHPVLERSRRAMELAEAAGLGFVCVAGTLDALHHHCGPVEAVMLGALTGIGGGVVRDLLLGEPPVVLRRGFYAVPALIGALLYTCAHEVGAGGLAAAIVAVAACFALRLLGISKDINLPQAGPSLPLVGCSDIRSRARRDVDLGSVYEHPLRQNRRTRPRRRNRPSPIKAEEALPLLAVDVDGVVLLLGGGDEGAPGAVQFELIDGIVHRVSIGAGDCLRRLSGHFELVWATGWQSRANDHFPRLLGLPRLPYVGFGGAAKFGSAHWKLEPLDAYANGRPVAWVDDNFDDICFEWAAAREAPTLLVPVDPRHGLRDQEAETLVTWGRPFAPLARG